MDVTLYLPDHIGQWAKEAGVNMSRTLRDELEAMMTQQTAMANALENAEEIRLDLADKDGRPYVGRFTGKLVIVGDTCTLYVTDDERVLVHDTDREQIVELDDLEEELPNWFVGEDYIDACNALGVSAVVDI
jgi:post-segregation antitoxin (ccd killing protein)